MPRLTVPSSVRTVLAYSRRGTIVCNAGVSNQNIFTGNGPFDPDVTGVGGQPLGYDQWHAFYNKNRTLASVIEVSFSNTTGASAATVTFEWALAPTNSSSTFLDVDTAACVPYAKQGIVNTNLVGMPRGPIRSRMETDLIMGLPKSGVLIDDNLAGSSGANPAELWYWQFVVQPLDHASTATVEYQVRLFYLVDFFDEQLLSLSATIQEKGGHPRPHGCDECTGLCQCRRTVSSQTSGQVTAVSRYKKPSGSQ
jgi:hypothetical protein